MVRDSDPSVLPVSKEFQKAFVEFYNFRTEQLCNENDHLRRAAMKNIPTAVLMGLRKNGIDGRFQKGTPELLDNTDEFPAFFECPLCGAIEFRVLRSAINCRQFKTPCCRHTVSIHIWECPCDDKRLDCLEKPIISTFYIYTG